MKNIALVPPSYHFLNNKIFDISDPILNRDNILFPYHNLKEQLYEDGIIINTIDLCEDLREIDLVLFFDLNYKYLYKCIKSGLENKLIYFAFEPPVVSEYHSKEGLEKIENIFRYIMTWNDDLIDNEKYFKMNFPQYLKNKAKTNKSFNQKKLLINISGNKKSNHPKELYSSRLNVINYFEQNNCEDFDLYGMRWNKPIDRCEKLGLKKVKKYNNYKGKVENKLEVYADYKFALCFENMKNIKGYITEKIFDCFKGKIVPIYWGAKNITDYIPEGCFIDYRNFISVDEMYNFISSMNEKEYNEYIKNIEEYLNSNNIKQFNSEAFYEKIIFLINKISNEEKKQINIKKIDKIKIQKKYYVKTLKIKIKKTLFNR